MPIANKGREPITLRAHPDLIQALREEHSRRRGVEGVAFSLSDVLEEMLRQRYPTIEIPDEIPSKNT